MLHMEGGQMCLSLLIWVPPAGLMAICYDPKEVEIDTLVGIELIEPLVDYWLSDGTVIVEDNESKPLVLSNESWLVEARDAACLD